MLEIINNLAPFFEDCYRRVGVREYGRIIKISPPTASKLLKVYEGEGLLTRESERQYLYYFANNESWIFRDLSRVYWKTRLEKAGLISFFEKGLLHPVIVLFGSLSKAEARKDSDIDVAVFSPAKKSMNVSEFEGMLKRNIQLFVYRERGDVESKELLNNILNGYTLRGNW